MRIVKESDDLAASSIRILSGLKDNLGLGARLVVGMSAVDAKY